MLSIHLSRPNTKKALNVIRADCFLPFLDDGNKKQKKTSSLKTRKDHKYSKKEKKVRTLEKGHHMVSRVVAENTHEKQSLKDVVS